MYDLVYSDQKGSKETVNFTSTSELMDFINRTFKDVDCRTMIDVRKEGFIIEFDEDKRREYLKQLVGEKVECCNCGCIVDGLVLNFYEDEFTFNLEIEHEPVVWGDETYTKAYTFERKCDNYGSMAYVKPILN